MKKTSHILGLAALGLLSLSSVSYAKTEEPTSTKATTGLQIQDTQVGSGAEATNGKLVTVHYIGWVSDQGKKGKQFNNSYERGQPIPFMLGQGRVIKGWDEGILGMKVGGKRTLVVPPELGYGDKKYGELIPENSTLIFEVELVGVS